MSKHRKRAGIKVEQIVHVDKGRRTAQEDVVVSEEPLEMRVEYGPPENRATYTLAITMRTPGNDEALIRGFVYTEGIIDSPAMVTDTRSEIFDLEGYQSVTAILDPEVNFVPEQNQRHFYTTSSCGVCGKASIDMVRQITSFRLRKNKPQISSGLFMNMQQDMRSAQQVFEQTGGIHAAALFDAAGHLIDIKEDVGRHNAVDKLIGAVSLKRALPLDDCIMLVSGRAGFELVQKAAVTGVAIFAAVGAPSTLAIELARSTEMTLIGFLRAQQFNIYSEPGRITETQ